MPQLETGACDVCLIDDYECQQMEVRDQVQIHSVKLHYGMPSRKQMNQLPKALGKYFLQANLGLLQPGQPKINWVTSRSGSNFDRSLCTVCDNSHPGNECVEHTKSDNSDHCGARNYMLWIL